MSKLFRNATFLLLILSLAPGLIAAPEGGSPPPGANPPPTDEPPSATQDGFADSWLDGFKIFGSVRFRPELRSNYDFSTRRDDNVELIGQRIQLGFEKKWADDIVARIVLQDSRVWGGAPGSDNGFSTANNATGESTDMREAWLEARHLFELPLAIQAGRQILAYGDERLVGAVEFTNVGRSFDALRLKWETKHFDSHLFGAVLAEEDSDGAGNATAVGSQNSSGQRFTCSASTGACSVSASTARELDDAYFTGLYNTVRAGELFTFDFYALGVHKKWIARTTPIANIAGAEITSEDRSRQRDNLYTFGGRLTNRTTKGKKKAKGPIDFSLEYAAQRGRTGEEIAASWDSLNMRVPVRDIFGNQLTDSTGQAQTVPLYVEKRSYGAFAYAANAGVTYGRVRLGGEAAVASGDGKRTDGVDQTFRNLFPTNHAHYGQADLVGWANMRAGSLDLNVDFGKFGRIELAYWHVKKHRVQDGWYDAGGSLKTNASTESAANARFGHEYTGGVVTSRAVGTLRRDLFREYDLTYWVDYKQLSLVAGYSRIHGGDSIADVNNDVLSAQDVRRPAFDPRADYVFVMVGLKF